MGIFKSMFWIVNKAQQSATFPLLVVGNIYDEFLANLPVV